MALTRIQHRREAEKLLGQASFVRSPAECAVLDPQAVPLLIERARVHAMLASATVPEDEGCATVAQPDAYLSALVGAISKGLTSSRRDERDFARHLMYELDDTGAGVEEALRIRSESAGHGPFHHAVDGVVYPLSVQFTDREGVIWEHTGAWTILGQPVMGTDEDLPDLPDMTLNDLVYTRSPIRPRTFADARPSATGASR